MIHTAVGALAVAFSAARPVAGQGQHQASATAAVPVAHLLATPTATAVPRPVLDADLAATPELFFQESLPANLTPEQWKEKMLEQFAGIRKLNQAETDGFWKVLRSRRSDLAGLPLQMGDACRMPQAQLKPFSLGLLVLRAGLVKASKLSDSPTMSAAAFWDQYDAVLEKVKSLPAQKDTDWTGFARGQVAGLMQVLAVEAPAIRHGLVRKLAEIPDPAATQALARLAVFDPDQGVRRLAIGVLRDRDRNTYTDVLLTGLRYPWPAVAQQAADAVVGLKRTDLIRHLVALLDAPDPRLPVARTAGKEPVFEAKQLVRVNHHRNCLMCHAPADNATPKEVLTAPMPAPGQPLPSLSSGYSKKKSKLPNENDIIVRIDTTYLRQDFSALLPVPQANPWPAQQRFDFLVRTVRLTPAQAASFRHHLTLPAGTLTPYQVAAQAALRRLTGLDAQPTSAAWKKALQMPG